jgi:GMP synthase (glutamine-hydrolysing)
MTRIVVVDNHGQFTHLEHRALRDLGVDSEVVDNTTPAGDVTADGVVLSGGPDIDRTGRCGEYLDRDWPVLGICLGMQFMARELGGAVGPGDYGGYADVTVEITDDRDPLVGSLAPETRVWASHADEVVEVPPGFERTARSDICAVEAMSDTDRDRYGVQFHPEVSHTERGQEVFENFLAVCQAASESDTDATGTHPDPAGGAASGVESPSDAGE